MDHDGPPGPVRDSPEDAAAIAEFMTYAATAPPRELTGRACVLATLVGDLSPSPRLSVGRATLAEALRRLRLRLIEEP